MVVSGFPTLFTDSFVLIIDQMLIVLAAYAVNNIFALLLLVFFLADYCNQR